MNPLSLDPYLFADNNPITGMDPTGLMTFDFVHGGFAETWSGNTAQEIHADASLAWFASAADPAYRKFLQAAADALEGLAGPAAGPLGGWAQGQIPSPGDTETTPWNSTPSLDGSGDQRSALTTLTNVLLQSSGSIALLFTNDDLSAHLDLGSVQQTIRVKTPDYVTVNVSGFLEDTNGAEGSVAVTRYGQVFWGGGVGGGIPGVSLSVEASWIYQSGVPSKTELKQFVGGWGMSADGLLPVLFRDGYPIGGVAGGLTWGDVGVLQPDAFARSTGIGIGYGASVVAEYMLYLGEHPSLGW